MGEEQLLKALSEEAERECDRIISAAMELRDTEIARSKNEAELNKEKALAEHKKTLQKEAEVNIAGAHLHSKTEILKAKTIVIDNIFEEALNRITKLDKKKYSSYLQLLYNELKEAWPAEVEAKAYVNPKDEALIDSKDITLETDDSVQLGIVFKSKDGSHCFENTARSRSEKAKAELIVELNNILFQKDQ
ncbi:MAG: V-type ATP synthase subunit E [Deltaproteobacteria bacterium]|nr:V-type ATP synthase subunit E [Deltaproteobacteria bacterium]